MAKGLSLIEKGFSLTYMWLFSKHEDIRHQNRMSLPMKRTFTQILWGVGTSFYKESQVCIVSQKQMDIQFRKFQYFYF